ncbi:hypothetical protein ACS0TY_012129 [Phlomoides rotata]
MSRTAAPVLLSAVFLLSLSAASAFNITLLLSRYPGYETFNDLLSKTNLAREINRRSTITILALTNDSMAPIAAKTEEVQTRILSNHVVLDYYDNLKLNKLKNTKTVLTTLFQASGTANGQQGFLAVVHRKDGSIVFGSAVKGAPLVSILEGSVAAQPYNISVLAVSQPIIGPGIDGEWVPVAEAPAPAKKKASPPPAASPVEDEVVADAPAPEEAVPAPAPAEAPAADADADDGSSPVPKSGAGKGAVSGVTFGLVVALISLVAA